MSAIAATRRHIPPGVPVAIAAAWTVAVVAEATGSAAQLHHDGLIEGGLPIWAAVALFLGAWQLMTAAMMLPSSLPLVRLYWGVTRTRYDAARSLAAFLGGYAAVWSAFGLAAFLGDVVLHRIHHAVPALDARPWLIPGGVLVGAGLFQFSALKEKCLEECRHPGAYLMRHYRRGVAQAFKLGRGHGLFCLGCCWALMLLMFAAGFANLVWMAGFAALTAYEKIGRHGKTAARVAGIVLLVWGALVLTQPVWLPQMLRGF